MAEARRPEEPQQPQEQQPATQPMTPPAQDRTIEQTLRLPATVEPPITRLVEPAAEAQTVRAPLPRRPRPARQPVSVAGFQIDPLTAALALAAAVLLGVLLTALLLRNARSASRADQPPAPVLGTAEQQSESLRARSEQSAPPGSNAPSVTYGPATDQAGQSASDNTATPAAKGTPNSPAGSAWEPQSAPSRSDEAGQGTSSRRDEDEEKAAREWDKERDKRQDEHEREREKRDAEREREREKRDAEREREREKRDREAGGE